jgi:hypothetical protein
MSSEPFASTPLKRTGRYTKRLELRAECDSMPPDCPVLESSLNDEAGRLFMESYDDIPNERDSWPMHGRMSKSN